jgi:hypothetical protein
VRDGRASRQGLVVGMGVYEKQARCLHSHKLAR